MARVLAISSQVARGHVGLSAIVPALQSLGHEVIALPTILLSNHPGHPHVAGERIAPELLSRMLGALQDNGWLAGVDALLTGYMPSVVHVAFAAEAMARVRAHNPNALVLVDPVLGDHPKGLYIDAAAANAVRDVLVPQATLLKLNAFELEWLARRRITDALSVRALVDALGYAGPAVVTSVPCAGKTLANVLIAGGAVAAIACRVQRLDHVPHGTGDLLSALLAGHTLRLGAQQVVFSEQVLARAVAGVDLVVRASMAHDELCLVAQLGNLATCAPLPLVAVD